MEAKLICLTHPSYSPEHDVPTLSCKTCCSLYVDWVKTQQGIIIESANGRVRGRIGYTARCYNSLRELISLMEEDEYEQCNKYFQ